MRSRVVPGSTAAAISAATLPVLLASLAFHDALKTVPYTDVMQNEQLGRLRYYVDDVMTLIEVLNEAIPAPDIDSDLIDARSGLDIVKTLHLNKRRPGAPVRR